VAEEEVREGPRDGEGHAAAEAAAACRLIHDEGPSPGRPRGAWGQGVASPGRCVNAGASPAGAEGGAAVRPVHCVVHLVVHFVARILVRMTLCPTWLPEEIFGRPSRPEVGFADEDAVRTGGKNVGSRAAALNGSQRKLMRELPWILRFPEQAKTRW
jgi:hypothetical protein